MNQPNQPNQPKEVNTPPTFQDQQKNLWTVKLTLGLIDEVLAETGTDLLPENHDVSPIINLWFYPRKLGALMWCLCRKQAESKKIDKDAFLGVMDASTLKAGWGAMADAIIFFIHQTQGEKSAEAIEKLIEAQMRVIEAGVAELIATIESSEVNQAMKATASRIGAEMKTGIIRSLESGAFESPES